jgi:hypothetical protein
VSIDVPAWVLCGPPKYAPEIVNIVAMYDTMYDIFVRVFGLNPGLFQNGQFQQAYRPNRESEIAPLLIRPNLYQYVAGISGVGRANHARVPVDTPQQFAQNVEGVLRGPDDKNTPGLMPKLAGDNPLKLFQTSNSDGHSFYLSQYANGTFSTDAPWRRQWHWIKPAWELRGRAFCRASSDLDLPQHDDLHAAAGQPLLSDAFRIRLGMSPQAPR